MKIHFKTAEWLDMFGGLGENGSIASGAFIEEYESWLKKHNVEFKYISPFVIVIDDKYEQDILAFKLKYGL
jgi:hypothetical protein